MLFSIITVTKDNLAGLKATYKSLKEQNFQDFEWIVIDGASEDDTPSFLKATDVSWISEKDNGIYDAMNKGLARAGGDYILFLNAGDRLAASETLAEIAAQQNGEDFIYGDAFEGGHYKKARNHDAADLGMFTHHQSMFYGRNVLNDMRFNMSYSISGDYDFTLRFLQKTKSILYIAKPICIFEQGGISQTNAAKGRWEQFFIRRDLQVSNLPENLTISILQTMLWHFRRCFPSLYWHFKKDR